MAAQTAGRMPRRERLQYITGVLKASNAAFKGAIACVESATGKIVRGTAATGLVPIGLFDETVASSGSDGSVRVRLFREVEVTWYANGATTDTVLATDLQALAYVLDDQTVSRLSASKSALGTIWAVDASKGVAVEVK